MKNQNSNFKKLTTIYFSLHHFFSQIRCKNIMIRTDNTKTIYNINKKSGAKNL
jgi:hypothetical protein